MRNIYRSCIAVLLIRLTIGAGFAQNGIDVGKAKVYDNRALTLMLDTLGDQLRQVQVVNQGSLASALGVLQGYQSQETIRAGSIQASVPFTDPASTAANPLPPKIPTAAAVPWDTNATFTNFTLPSEPKYGLNASDLLGDQVNLTYQIFNIRMILDRAISDRLTGHDAKLQTVLGFNVSLDPPRNSVDSAAIVEVTVMHKDKPLSVVALLPQEKTYNAAALSTKANAFGGSVATKLITVGYSERRRGQTFYLYRDNDTVAFERTPEDCPDPTSKDQKCHSVTFGWQFRPVLGRKSVSPGARQMFAVISIDEADFAEDTEGVANLTVQVKTHWRKYHRPTLTTAERDQIPWWNQAGHLLGLGVPFAFAPKGEAASKYPLAVPKTSAFQKDLSPIVRDVSWTWVGNKELLVSVAGQNFFRDTKVAVGGKLLETAPGLTIKSDQAMDLLVDAGSVTDAAILGRYGSAIPLMRRSEDWQLGIAALKIEEPVGEYRYVDIYLAKLNKDQTYSDLEMWELPGGGLQSRLERLKSDRQLAVPGNDWKLSQPIIALNGTLLPGPWTFTEVRDASGCRILARGYVSTSIFKRREGNLSVAFPFMGPKLITYSVLNEPNDVIDLQRLHESQNRFHIRLKDPLRFSDKWSIVLTNGVKLPLQVLGCPTPTAAGKPQSVQDVFCSLAPENFIDAMVVGDLVTDGQKLLLVSNSGGIYDLPVPKKKDAEKAPEAPLPTIQQYDAKWVELKASEFKDFDSVELDGRVFTAAKEVIKELNAEGKPSKVEVFIGRAITAKPGTLELVFRDKAGKLTNRAKIVVKCTECEGEPSKKKEDAK